MGATAVGPISSWLLATSNNLKKELFAIAHDAQVLFAILKHSHSPWPAKIVSVTTYNALGTNPPVTSGRSFAPMSILFKDFCPVTIASSFQK